MSSTYYVIAWTHNQQQPRGRRPVREYGTASSKQAAIHLAERVLPPRSRVPDHHDLPHRPPRPHPTRHPQSCTRPIVADRSAWSSPASNRRERRTAGPVIVSGHVRETTTGPQTDPRSADLESSSTTSPSPAAIRPHRLATWRRGSHGAFFAAPLAQPSHITQRHPAETEAAHQPVP